MSERDFEISGRKFKLNKLNAFEQLRVVKRVAPVLSEMMVAHNASKKLDLSKEEDQLKALTPIMNGISKLSDEDTEKLIVGLCSAVEMQQMPAGNWARVANASGLMFQDLELPLLLQISGKSFMYNLSGFFDSLPKASHGGV